MKVCIQWKGLIHVQCPLGIAPDPHLHLGDGEATRWLHVTIFGFPSQHMAPGVNPCNLNLGRVDIFLVSLIRVFRISLCLKHSPQVCSLTVKLRQTGIFLAPVDIGSRFQGFYTRWLGFLFIVECRQLERTLEKSCWSGQLRSLETLERCYPQTGS